MSHEYKTRNQNRNLENNHSEVSQKKIDPVAQARFMNSLDPTTGWGISDNIPPIQKFTKEEEEQVQLKSTGHEAKDPEMSLEHVQRAIDCNNSLGFSILGISYLQKTLCVPQTGMFDADTVIAIGKVSVENRVAPELINYSNVILRDFYLTKQQGMLSEKEKSKIAKFEEKIRKLNQKRGNGNQEKIDEKIEKLDVKVDEIKDPYLTPNEHEHINSSADLGSTSEIESRVESTSNNFSASDGELDVSTFNTIFLRMVNDGLLEQALILSLEFDSIKLNNNTLAITYDPQTDYNYRVKVPFSQLEINNTSGQNLISNAPNSLKNIYIGKSAFSSYGSVISIVKSAQSINVEQTNNANVSTNATETNQVELSNEQIEQAIANNGFVFTDNKAILIVQSTIGVQNTGIIDESTIRGISTFQTTNSLASTDGSLNKDTINSILTEVVNNNEYNAALILMRDYYSLDDTASNDIILKYDSNLEKTYERDVALQGVEIIKFGASAFSDGLTSLHDAFKGAFGFEKTIENELIETLFSDANSERQSALWDNPNTDNQSGLVASIRDNFPKEQDISNYLSRTDISNDDKIAGVGTLSVELGRLEYLMGVLYHGGHDKIWESSTPIKNNKGPFVNYYKSKVGNEVNDSAWCTMFSGYLKRMLGFSTELSAQSGGPLIFNSGIRLDFWATSGMNVVTGVDDFDDPSDLENYSGSSIDTEDWITLRDELSVQGLTSTQKQQVLDTFLNERFTPQPGDIIVINPQSTTSNEPNQYHNSGYSHTMTVESFNSPTLTTVEGNRGHRTKGTSLDLSDSSNVIKVLFMARIGVEFFPQNDAENETVDQNNQQINLEHLVNPLKIMTRNLQLLADHKKYINSNTENASVYDMGDGTNGGAN